MVIQAPLPADLAQQLLVVAYDVLVFAVIIALAWGAGRLAGMLIGRLVARGGGDSVLRQTVVGRALLKSGFTSYSFSNGLTRWLIYLVGFLLALQSLNIAYVTASVAAFLAYLPDLIGGVFILIVGVVLSDWMGELVKRSVSPDLNQIFYMSLIGDLVKIILYFVTITIALAHLGVDVTILYIIAQALAWGIAISIGIAAGIALGLALKDRVKNWLPSS
jgi:small-conductance mechanosensitive channel